MPKVAAFVRIGGARYPLAGLDAGERRLLARLAVQFDAATSWVDFVNLRNELVGRFYDARGLPRAELWNVPLFRISQRLCGRVAQRERAARTGSAAQAGGGAAGKVGGAARAAAPKLRGASVTGPAAAHGRK